MYKMSFKRLLVLCVLALSGLHLQAQASGPPHTYAVIVGISGYLDPDIPRLKYANRDAEEFAAFLRSGSGGSVPEENITLLIDSAATSGAVNNAIDELRNTVKKGDLVYFYFSGHGDIENKTIYKNGFLICYDSPPTNYNRFSLSMDDLNETANTLSGLINARVVLITDACRSGKLAGSMNKGNFLVGEQFRAVKKKEIRITSSAAEQLSNENEAWGGGRGVFSYYLINGLKGLADQQQDGIVTLDEISKYLDSSLARDPILHRENLVQTPVFLGNPGFALANVDAAIKKETEMAAKVSLDMVSAPPPQTTELISVKPQVYFFQLLKAVNLEKLLDTLGLKNVTDDKLPFVLINALKENDENGSKKRLSEPGIRKLEELEHMLRSDEGAFNSFNFFQMLKTVDLEKMLDTLNLLYQSDIIFLKSLSAVNMDIMPDTLGLMNDINKKKLSFKLKNALDICNEYGRKKRISEQGIRKFEELVQMLRSDQGALKRFKNKLAVAFDEEGQKVIDLYLKGDEAELERRRYYNSKSSGYGVYPKLFSVAIRLTQPGSNLRRNLEIKLHYFTGVTYRLQLPMVKDKIPIIEKAIKEQKKALSLVDNAPYVFNEMGNLSVALKKFGEAEAYYHKAIEGAPSWIIPHANLIGLYTRMKKTDMALKQYDTALALNPDFQGLNVSGGILYEQTGNLLIAEELLRKSIHQNSRHFLPFERLGFMYINTTQYAAADSFIYEAEVRKQGFNLKDDEPLWWLNPLDYSYSEIICPFDSSWIRDDDPIGQTVWGLVALRRGNLTVAEKHLKKALMLDRGNPIAFHYLGKLLFEQQRWQEAETIFQFAVRFHMDRQQFKNAYRDSLYIHYVNAPSDKKKCILSNYFSAWYEKMEDPYYLGSLYERWGHLSEAAEQYIIAIGLDEDKFRGLYKLWNVWEKLGRYTDAEKVIMDYSRIDTNQGRNELYGFYNRMISRFPEEGNWYYQQGRLLYQLAKDSNNIEKYPEISLIRKEAGGEKEFDEPVLAELLSDRMDYKKVGTIPGPGDAVFEHIKILQPYGEQGIAFLKKADSMLRADDGIHAEINDKVGDMFTWLGLPYQASAHYQVAVDARPDNATLREKLADSYSASYQLRNALAQLDSLLNRGQINFPKQVVMAGYLVHSGKFEKAQQLLTEAEKNHLFPQADVIDLNGRLRLLRNQPEEALNFYLKKLELFPGDCTTMYSIARIYAKMRQKDLAWKWLDKALLAGFEYPYVLKNDPYLENIRNAARWKFLNNAIDRSFEVNAEVDYIQFRNDLLAGKDWLNFIK